MKRIIILISVVALLSGCGMFQKVFKHKTSEKTLISTSKSDQSETNLSILDSSITTVVERIDTTIQTKEVIGAGIKNLDLTKIKEGLNVIDDEFLTLNQKYDPSARTLKTEYILKPRKVVVNSFKKTVAKNNIKTSVMQESKKSSKNITENEKSEAVIRREPSGKVFIIFFLIVAVLWGIYKMLKNKKP